MIVREDVRAAPGGDHRDLEDLRQTDEVGGAARAEDASAGQDDRPAGAGQQLEDRPDVVRFGLDARRSERLRLAGDARDELVKDLLRDRHDDRTRASRDRMTDRFGDRRLRAGRRVDVDRPLGQTADRPDDVRFLERLASAVRPVDPADDREHRARVGPRGVDPDGEIGGTHGARREGHGGPAGQLAMGLGHECRAALVTGRDHADPHGRQRIEETEEALARDRERRGHAGRSERVGDEPADGPRFDDDRRRCVPSRGSARRPRAAPRPPARRLRRVHRPRRSRRPPVRRPRATLRPPVR